MSLFFVSLLPLSKRDRNDQVEEDSLIQWIVGWERFFPIPLACVYLIAATEDCIGVFPC